MGIRPNNFKVSVIVPCYYEEGSLPFLYEKLIPILKSYPDYEIIFVDDGSTDETLNVIKKLRSRNQKIRYFSFSRNFGHQNALKAGLDHALGDCVVSMDSDLQHPPEIIPSLIAKWLEGYEVVYTKRLDDPNLSLFKRWSSKSFYWVLNRLSKIDLGEGCADFRLLDKKVVVSLRGINESDLFFRGLISWIGFKQFRVEYAPESRVWGKTKYNFGKMVRFSLAGITAFSTRPLHLSTMLGSFLSFLCMLYVLWVLYLKIFTNESVLGWATIVVSILFIGSMQLMLMGIIGEYLGKLFMQSKGRPLYIISESSEE